MADNIRSRASIRITIRRASLNGDITGRTRFKISTRQATLNVTTKALRDLKQESIVLVNMERDGDEIEANLQDGVSLHFSSIKRMHDFINRKKENTLLRRVFNEILLNDPDLKSISTIDNWGYKA